MKRIVQRSAKGAVTEEQEDGRDRSAGPNRKPLEPKWLEPKWLRLKPFWLKRLSVRSRAPVTAVLLLFGHGPLRAHLHDPLHLRQPGGGWGLRLAPL